MLEPPAHYVGEDLRVVMGMCGEAPARFDHVIVHHDERMKAVVVFVVIVGEGKGEPGVEPPMLGFAPFFAWSFSNAHEFSLPRRTHSSKLELHAFNRSFRKPSAHVRKGMGFLETQPVANRIKLSSSSSRFLTSFSSNSENSSSSKRNLLKINFEGSLTCRCPLFPNSSR
jgi:hypothetical protein